MVRNYVKKSNRQQWSEVNMAAAIAAVKNKEMGYYKSSKQFGVPQTTLERRIKGLNKRATEAKKHLGNYITVFTPEQEDELLQHILDMERQFYGLTTKDVRYIAFNWAESLKKDHPFNKEQGLAGKDWLNGFCKRHPKISLRQPEATSAARARAFNQVNVNQFFTLLSEVIDNVNSRPNVSNIYNVDETGITTVQTKCSKIFAERGKSQVGSITSAERGTLSTAVVCMSASGQFIPPMLIFARKRMKKELEYGAPQGTIFQCHSSGWMQLDIFTTWFHHFLNCVKPNAQSPALLILDGHHTHTKNLDVINLAKDNFVTILCLPPHCSHRLQPLDVAFMGPLNTFYTQEIQKWLRNHPGRVITQYQISEVFGEAYLRAALPKNAINGFKKTGIFPYNPEVFSESDFIPAEVTENPVGLEEIDRLLHSEIGLQESGPRPIVINQPEANTSTFVQPEGRPTRIDNIHTKPNPIAEASPVSANTGPTNLEFFQNSPIIGSPNSNGSAIEFLPISSIINLQLQTTPNRSSNGPISDILPLESNKPIQQPLSPRDIMPLPKITEPRPKRKGRCGQTSIITSSPYKSSLENSKNKASTSRPTKRKLYKPNKNLKTKSCKLTQKIQTNSSDSDSDEHEDVQCLFCNDVYSRSASGEGWVRCSDCRRWAHDACAGLDEDDENFVCDLCA